MADYCTVSELRAAIDKTLTDDDTTIGTTITAISRTIDQFCNRPDGFVALSTATARTFTGSGQAVQWIDECAAITLVAVKDSPSDSTYTSWAATDWIAGKGDPRNPDFNHTPYDWIMIDPNGDYASFSSGAYTTRRGFRPESIGTRGVPTVRVTAKWGHSLTVPPAIKQACLIEAGRIYKRGQSAFADTLANVDFGQLMYTKGLDPATQLILVSGRYVRPAVG